jgi:hypothetical protein
MKLNSITAILLEFFALIGLMISVTGFIYLDTSILNNRLTELSFTEFAQSGFILISTVLFLIKTKKEPSSAGLFILISGLFAMMFVRESDYYLDAIYHGFWKVPVSIIFIVCLFFTYKNKTKIIQPLLKYQNTKAFTYTFIGFLITIVFSRLFGTGSLWIEIATSADSSYIKTVVQEGLELFGYSLVLMGAIVVNLTESKTDVNN